MEAPTQIQLEIVLLVSEKLSRTRHTRSSSLSLRKCDVGLNSPHDKPVHQPHQRGQGGRRDSEVKLMLKELFNDLTVFVSSDYESIRSGKDWHERLSMLLNRVVLS